MNSISDMEYVPNIHHNQMIPKRSYIHEVHFFIVLFFHTSYESNGRVTGYFNFLYIHTSNVSFHWAQ